MKKEEKNMDHKRILIIYHNQDLDGVVSAAVARYYYDHHETNSVIRMVGYNYGQSFDEINNAISEHNPEVIVVTDISFGKDTKRIFKSWQDQGMELIWIDHHKTIIEESEGWGMRIRGIRVVGQSAAYLTWLWFGYEASTHVRRERIVMWDRMPMIIQAVNDYDVWNTDTDLGWETVLNIQYGLRVEIGLDPERAYNVLYSRIKSGLDDIAVKGKTIRDYERQKFESQVRYNAFRVKVCGYNAMCVNTLDFGSNIFEVFDPEPDIQLYVCFSVNIEKGSVRFGLYHHPSGGKDGVDCGKIAKGFGGGGHVGAAGFEIRLGSGEWDWFVCARELIPYSLLDDNKPEKEMKDNRTLAC